MNDQRQDEFGFGDQESGVGRGPEKGSTQEDPSDGWPQNLHAEQEVAKEQPKGASSLGRLLILIVLGLVLGGGAFFLLTPSSPTPTEQVVVAVRQPMPLPPTAIVPKPASVVSPEPKPELPAQQVSQLKLTAEGSTASSRGAAAPDPATAGPVKTAQIETIPVPEPAESQSKKLEGGAAKSTRSDSVSAVAGKEAKTRPEKAEPARVVTSTSTISSKASSAAKVVAGTDGGFQIQVGAFSQQKTMLLAEKKLRQLGYVPRREEINRPRKFFRLRAGRYPAVEARQRLKRMKLKVPSAFLIADKDELTLYAGSYSSAAAADEERRRLKKIGIEVIKVAGEVPGKLNRVSFGHYSGKIDAEKALDRVRRTGLEADLIPYKGEL